MDEFPDDLQPRIGYRIADGEAARLAELASFDHGWGRGFAAGIGGHPASIKREVQRRPSPDIPPELVKLAIEDVFGRPQVALVIDFVWSRSHSRVTANHTAKSDDRSLG
jgi:hypothetical protein